MHVQLNFQEGSSSVHIQQYFLTTQHGLFIHIFSKDFQQSPTNLAFNTFLSLRVKLRLREKDVCPRAHGQEELNSTLIHLRPLSRDSVLIETLPKYQLLTSGKFYF